MKENKIKIGYLLLFFAFFLRIITFMGMAEGDDLYYTLLADRFSHGDFSANFIFDLRWAVFLPVSLLYKIFGVSDLTSIAPTFFYGLFSVYFVYEIIKEETSPQIAAITTLLYSTFPVVLIYGNFLQTDPALEFFTLLSVFCFQKAALSGKMTWFVFGGLALGGMFFTRITGLFIAPLLSFYVIWKRGLNVQTVSGIGVAAIFTFFLPGIQGLIYYFFNGNFFHYISISKSAVSFQNSMNDVDPKDTFFYVRTLFKTEDFANWKMYGFNGWALLPAFLIYLYRLFFNKDGKETLFLIWYISYFLFMSFAPTSLSPYTTLIRNIRYSIIFTAPMCAFITAVLFQTFSKNRHLSYVMYLFFFFMIASNIFFSFENSKVFKSRRDLQKESVSYVLSNYPSHRIYLADRNTGRRISYYSGYKNNNYTHISSLSQIKTSGIFLLMGPGAYSETRFYIPKKELAAIKKDPPSELTLVKNLPYFNIYEAVPAIAE